MLLVAAWKSSSGESIDSGSFVPFVISTLSFHGMILVLTGWLLKVHGVGWSDAFGFREPRQNRAVLLAAGVAVLALPVGAVLLALWGTGIYLWILPIWAKRSGRRRRVLAGGTPVR